VGIPVAGSTWLIAGIATFRRTLRHRHRGRRDRRPSAAGVDLDRALAAKLDAAAATGLAAHILTQFSFSADAILCWNARLRDLGIDQPVRVGLPGPVTLTGLMRYARICGVGLRRSFIALMTAIEGGPTAGEEVWPARRAGVGGRSRGARGRVLLVRPERDAPAAHRLGLRRG
jgi:hypothetical protein